MKRKMILICLSLFIITGCGQQDKTYSADVDTETIEVIMNTKETQDTSQTEDMNEVSEDSADVNNEDTSDYIDADEYYSKNAQGKVTKEPVSEDNSFSEKEVTEHLSSLGFTGSPITTSYDMNGKYFNDIEITGSDERHPSYVTIYTAKNDMIWGIIVTGKQIIANPVIYNMSGKEPVQVIVSEYETICSYDSAPNNTYYITIPKEDVLKVDVSKIDANTLDNMTQYYIDMPE